MLLVVYTVPRRILVEMRKSEFSWEEKAHTYYECEKLFFFSKASLLTQRVSYPSASDMNLDC